VRKEWSQQVADQCGALLGQPHDAAVDGLPDGRDELHAEAVDGEAESVVEGDIWYGGVLAHRHARVLLGDPDGIGPEHVEPDARGAHPKRLDAGVVGLAREVVGLREVGGARLAEQAHATDVVDMGLGGDDVMGGPGPHGVEHPLVVWGLEAEARVDDHPAAVREEDVRGGRATRPVDGVGDLVRRVLVDGREQPPAGTFVDQAVDLVLDGHVTSILVSKRSK
jgi:hypothetical protein